MERLILFRGVGLILFLFMILEQIKYKYKKGYSIVGGIILTILLGIRKNTPDLDIYEKLYLIKTSYDVEKGYLLLQDLFILLKVNFNIFIIILGLITIFLMYRGFYYFTKYPNAAIFIYFSYYFLEKPYVQVRNALSIAIFLNFLPFIVENKKIKSILGIILSSIFHVSGYFYFTVLLLGRLKWTKIKIKLFYIFILFSGIFIYFFDITKIIIWISSFDLGRLSERIRVYFLSEEGKQYIKSTPLGIRSLFSPLIYTIYTIKILYLKKFFQNNLAKEKYIFILLSLSLLFRAASYKIIILGRVLGAFDFSEVLGLCLLLEVKQSKTILIYKIVYICLIGMYVFISNYVTGKNLNLW